MPILTAPKVLNHVSTIFKCLISSTGFPDSFSVVKNLPAMQKTLVQFLGQEDPLKKGEATHSSILGLPLWLSR